VAVPPTLNAPVPLETEEDDAELVDELDDEPDDALDTELDESDEPDPPPHALNKTRKGASNKDANAFEFFTAYPSSYLHSHRRKSSIVSHQ
jgi:hypothetical protein